MPNTSTPKTSVLNNPTVNKFLPKDILLLLTIMWIVFLIDFFIPFATFNSFGIRPRSLSGLMGIIFSPFLHGGFGHIISNSISLLGTGILVRLAVGSKQLRYVLLLGILGSGIGTWLFGSGGLVVGASGLVYALIGFLFTQAFFNPSLRSWFSAILAFVLFGGALLSLFNMLPYISWAAHFWGFVSGIGIAYLFKARNNEKAV
ncbi:rhomboid family intramembrane serine protease [uncultured Psychrosphaera sp.]|uniref:rhomboid family intramembrane serine protease n=1 Tax=uncultured Psychrosphaera sp. TaxID=1403522 RepID=UPI0026312D37|nr:rhomboid family intramembrane serine protease [uncultured Psychrosphaera sp.]